MPRYINADETYDDMLTEMAMTGYQSRALSVIDRQPTADVAPVVNAKWEKIQRTKHYIDSIGVNAETGEPFIHKKECKCDEYKCPVCKKIAKGDYLRFCDYCGARFNEMFEKDEND